jgi:hypothetical protein
MSVVDRQPFRSVAAAPLSQHQLTDVAIEEPLEKWDIAALLCDQLDRMDRRELILVIRGAKMPLVRPDMVSQLVHCDRDTLHRLAYLGRRTCRNQGY